MNISSRYLRSISLHPLHYTPKDTLRQTDWLTTGELSSVSLWHHLCFSSYSLWNLPPTTVLLLILWYLKEIMTDSTMSMDCQVESFDVMIMSFLFPLVFRWGQGFCLCSWLGCVVEWFKASATTRWLYHPDRRHNPDCWLRSGFLSPQGRLV